MNKKYITGMFYAFVVATFIGVVIVASSSASLKKVSVNNQTQLVLMVNRTNYVYPHETRLVTTTNDTIRVLAFGEVVNRNQNNVWLGVELNKKLTPNTLKLDIKLEDFP